MQQHPKQPLPLALGIASDNPGKPWILGSGGHGGFWLLGVTYFLFRPGIGASKWMVGRRPFPFGFPPIFQGRNVRHDKWSIWNTFLMHHHPVFSSQGDVSKDSWDQWQWICNISLEHLGSIKLDSVIPNLHTWGRHCIWTHVDEMLPPNLQLRWAWDTQPVWHHRRTFPPCAKPSIRCSTWSGAQLLLHPKKRRRNWHSVGSLD